MLIAWMVIGEIFGFFGFLLFFTDSPIFGTSLILIGLGTYYYGARPTRKKFWQLAGMIIGAAGLALGFSTLSSFWPLSSFDEIAPIIGLIAGGSFFLIAIPRTAAVSWNRYMVSDYYRNHYQFPHEVFR